jgi:hypothetical protein
MRLGVECASLGPCGLDQHLQVHFADHSVERPEPIPLKEPGGVVVARVPISMVTGSMAFGSVPSYIGTEHPR